MIKTTVEVEINYDGEVWVIFRPKEGKGVMLEAVSAMTKKNMPLLKQWRAEEIAKAEEQK